MTTDSGTRVPPDERLRPTLTRFSTAIHAPVFWPAVGLILVFVGLAAFAPARTNSVIQRISSAVVGNISWYYVLLVTVLVVIAFAIAFSRKGDTILGQDDEQPRYSRMSWFAMLFAAGMGIGLVFWGAAEPLSHYANPAPGMTDPSPVTRSREAMNTTFLHWGLHAWAIYAIVGLSIAYSFHRRGMPISIRSTLRPILGDRVNGRIGDTIDIVAVVGTIFGIATSLGFGVFQVASGTEFLGGPKANGAMLILFVAVISGLAALSVSSGLDAGIKFISNSNLVLAAILVLSVLVLGPTVFLLNGFVSDMGTYFQTFIGNSLRTFAFAGNEGTSWLGSWTVYYWGWWMSWSPFVGVFIARISRGRTVREFILGVLLVPTIITFFWFAIMGGNGLYQQMFGAKNLIGPEGSINVDTALFQTFENMPAGTALSVLAIVVVIIFFVSSSDSGSFVMSMLSTGGNANPPLSVRLTFATLTGLITAVMLGSGDPSVGMRALQTMAILVALPFSVVLAGMTWSIWRSLAAEESIRARLRGEEFARALAEDVSHAVRQDLYTDLSTQIRRNRGKTTETTLHLRDFFHRMRLQHRSRDKESQVSELLASQTGTENVTIEPGEELPTTYEAINAAEEQAAAEAAASEAQASQESASAAEGAATAQGVPAEEPLSPTDAASAPRPGGSDQPAGASDES